jgi:DNA-binding NtrC family response regulator
MNKLNVLIVDDEQIYRDEVAEFLDGSECNTFKAGSPSEAMTVLSESDIDLMFLDIKLPETDGLSFLKTIKEKFPELEVIMITGHGNMENVIEALRLGAIDFINKPFGTLEIRSALERSKRFLDLNHKLAKAELNYDTTSQKLRKIFGHEIIGKSSAIKNALDLVKRVSETDDTSVLITGNTGTGKELIAGGIHHLSSRSSNLFYDVNCSAVPENLFESEFFGHVKGAFTGAVENKAGWFEIANNGTLFLDEIGDMPLNQQIKLLRVLEERKIRRIGSHKDIKVNVRVIAATNKNLKKLISDNKFREDLYHRISTFTIHAEPLKKRKEDIPLLLDYFVESFAGKMRKNIIKIEENIISRLQNYNFPGNIRELKNMVEKAVIMCDGSTLQTKHFSLGSSTVIGENSATLDLNEVEKQTIRKALSLTSMKSEAAKLLNITHQSLNRKLKKYNLG